MQRLGSSHVLVVGLGGVGGYVAELLARAGVGKLTIVDADKVQASNINRQIIALADNVGNTKASLWGQRLHSINPDLDLTVMEAFLTEETIPTLLETGGFDFVADAIDSVAPKVCLLATCHQHKIPVISAMGAGAKSNPWDIRTADISKSHTCTLAKVVRSRLRQLGIRKGIPVIYSQEKPKKSAVVEIKGEQNKRSTAGTLSYLPALFGCFMAAHIIRQIADLEVNEKGE